MHHTNYNYLSFFKLSKSYILFILLQPTQQEIQDYVKTFERKMSAFLQDVKPLSDEELQKLGIKV